MSTIINVFFTTLTCVGIAFIFIWLLLIYHRDIHTLNILKYLTEKGRAATGLELVRNNIAYRSTIYNILSQMEEDGLITSKLVDDDVRREYSITEKGYKLLHREV